MKIRKELKIKGNCGYPGCPALVSINVNLDRIIFCYQVNELRLSISNAFIWYGIKINRLIYKIFQSSTKIILSSSMLLMFTGIYYSLNHEQFREILNRIMSIFDKL